MDHSRFKKLRDRLLVNGRCAECGSREDLTLDHIIPKSKGGPTTSSNLRVLCGTHNALKAALATLEHETTGYTPRALQLRTIEDLQKELGERQKELAIHPRDKSDYDQTVKNRINKLRHAITYKIAVQAHDAHFKIKQQQFEEFLTGIGYTQLDNDIRADHVFHWTKQLDTNERSIIILSLTLRRGVVVSQWSRLYYAGEDCKHAFMGQKLEDLKHHLDMWASKYLNRLEPNKRTEIIHSVKNWIKELPKAIRSTAKEYPPITCYSVSGHGIGTHFWVQSIQPHADDSVRITLVSEKGNIITDVHHKLVSKCDCNKWEIDKIPWMTEPSVDSSTKSES